MKRKPGPIPDEDLLLDALWERSPDAWDWPDAYHKFHGEVMPTIAEVVAAGHGYEEALVILIERLGVQQHPVPLWGPTKLSPEDA